jgi:hypothetical protein
MLQKVPKNAHNTLHYIDCTGGYPMGVTGLVLEQAGKLVGGHQETMLTAPYNHFSGRGDGYSHGTGNILR